MSHTYENLARNFTKTSEAERCAKRIPLNHAICGQDAEEKFFSVLKTGLLQISSTFKRDATTASESELGIPSAVYFYAGRVYWKWPYDGNMCVLIFGGALDTEADDSKVFEASVSGKANPFDSGGLAKNNLLLKWNEMPGVVDKKDYLAKHSEPLERWREYFALFLTAFFDTPKHYWESGPTRPIDNMERTGDNGMVSHGTRETWRNWTFEIRAEMDVSTAIARRGYVHRDLSRKMMQLSAEFPDIAAAIAGLYSNDDDPVASAESEAKALSLAS